LWFDVDGPGVVPGERELRQRPTVVLVHGGPGVYDHSYFKPDFARLADHAQVVYLDLRGHGQSDWGDVGSWSLERCADDLRAFCDALCITVPVVFGHSMGGPIVLLYGVRHPGHAAGLIVQSGFARWDTPRMVDAFRRLAESWRGAATPVKRSRTRSGPVSSPPLVRTARTRTAMLASRRTSRSTPTEWS
jgi:proline iminopeptidase